MISIAIDGPSSAGKSTMAKKIAEKLGYIYVDTGALYRSIGLYAVRMGADTNAQNEITPLLSKIKIDLKHIDGVQRILLNGEDVSEEIREPQMSMAASNVSAIGAVREFLLDMQKDIAKSNNIIMDGRDIGTVVLPKAQVKIFLTAT
ncbi:MAG: (d)CMP kinase, partial [Oscillospiraceae bacterium]